MFESFQVKECTVKELFTGDDNQRLFHIPAYQRPYSWGDEECEKLWDDFERFFIQEEPLKSKAKYFIGAIVAYRNEAKNRYEIIDGQQRITTLMLLLKMFYDYIDKHTDRDDADQLKNNGGILDSIEKALWAEKFDETTLEGKFDIETPVLSSEAIDDDKSIQGFQSVMKTRQLDKKSRRKTEDETLYEENYWKFDALREERFNNGPLTKKEPRLFAKAILDYCGLLFVSCKDSQAALRIFNTLNDRGLALRDADVLKSRIFEAIGSDDREKAKFMDEWRTFGILAKRANNLSPDKTDGMDEMFRMLMMWSKATHGNKDADMALRDYFGEKQEGEELITQDTLGDWLIPITSLFASIADIAFPNNQVDGTDGGDDDAYDLDEKYEKLWNDKSKQYLHVLSCLKKNAYWRHLLTVFYLKHSEDDREILKHLLEHFLRKILAFNLAYVIYGVPFTPIRQKTYELLCEIWRDGDFSSMGLLDFMKEKAQRDSDFSEQTLGKVLDALKTNSQYQKPITLLHAYLNEEQDGMVPLTAEVEHIFPKSWEKHVSEDATICGMTAADMADKLYEAFGNKVMLEKKLNIKASDNYWSKKQKIYKGVPQQITRGKAQKSEIADVHSVWDLSQWGKNEIQERDKLVKHDLFVFFASELGGAAPSDADKVQSDKSEEICDVKTDLEMSDDVRHSEETRPDTSAANNEPEAAPEVADDAQMQEADGRGEADAIPHTGPGETDVPETGMNGDSLAEQEAGLSYEKISTYFNSGKHAYDSGKFEEAVKWWKPIAKQGDGGVNVLAMYELGICFYEGQGVEQNDATAVDYWQKAAEHDCAEAQYRLGCCLAEGRGVKQNMAEAANWWCKVMTREFCNSQTAGKVLEKLLSYADKDEPEAMFALGICYAEGGVGAYRDLAQAIGWWNKAARHDPIRAADLVKQYAEKCVDLSAERGLSVLLCYLGDLYDNGTGLDVSEENAAYWWWRACQRDNGDAALKRLIDASCMSEQSRGSRYAQYYLGCCYWSGIKGIVPRNQAKAAECWWRAAKQGYEKAFDELASKEREARQSDPYVKYYLGLCYATVQGTCRNVCRAVELWADAIRQGCEEAFEQLKQTAEKGEVAAQAQLGIAYLEGKGLNRNLDAAVKWLKCSAQQGDAESMYRLGCCYADESYSGHDLKEAAEYWHNASEKGHPDAKYRLAMCYCNGDGRDKDVDAACDLLRQAAELGNAEALTELQEFDEKGIAAAKYAMGLLYANGVSLENGVRVEKNMEKAAKLLYESAQGGFPEAVTDLRASAENGSAEACYYLGLCYAEGTGIGKDMDKAVKCWREAARGNNPEAQYQLGCCLAEGRGVPVDMREAAKLWEQAAKSDHRDAKYRLGECYAYGRGVDKNMSLAEQWLVEAAKQRHPEAIKLLVKFDEDEDHPLDAETICLLGKLFQKGLDVEENPAKAFACYRRASRDCVEAQYCLGLCYQRGYGVEKDPTRAKLWLDKARDAGYGV